MARSQFYDSVQDSSGNFVTTSEVTVYLYGTTTKATIYENESGSTQKANPFYPTDGFINFWAEPNSYDVRIVDTANPITFNSRTMRFDAIPAVSGVISQTINDGAIVNNDVSSSAAISYSKLNLNGSIVNADINSAAAINYSKLNLSNLIVNSDIATAASISQNKIAGYYYATSFPSSPYDGQECVIRPEKLVPFSYIKNQVGSNNVEWTFRYRSDTSKWVFMSGLPIGIFITTSGSITSTTYATYVANFDAAIPITGTYLVEIGAKMTNPPVGGNRLYFSFDAPPGLPASDANSLSTVASTNVSLETTLSRKVIVNLASSSGITCKARVTGGTGTISDAYVLMTPIVV